MEKMETKIYRWGQGEGAGKNHVQEQIPYNNMIILCIWSLPIKLTLKLNKPISGHK